MDYNTSDAARAAKARYRVKNRDAINAKERERYHANLEKARERTRNGKRKYYETHRRREYQDIYEQHFKVKIPTGWHIHHKDGNQENNDPHNLLCLENGEHIKLHCIKERA
jgi:hypothetical protein